MDAIKLIGQTVIIPNYGNGVIVAYKFEQDVFSVKFSDSVWLDVTPEFLNACGEMERLRKKLSPDPLERFAEGLANAERQKSKG